MKKRLLTGCLVPILFVAIVKARAGSAQLEKLPSGDSPITELSEQVSHLQDEYTTCLGEVVMKTKSLEHAASICEEERLAVQYSIEMLHSAKEKGRAVNQEG